MANNNNEGADNNPDNLKDSGSDKSFVGKFVSGIINSTPLSKWFGKESASKSFIRRREDDEEYDVSYNFQPPTKRAKLPTDVEHNTYGGHIFESPVTVHASNNVNSSSKVFGKFPEPVAGPSGIKSRKLFEKHNTSSTNTTSLNSFENQLETINGEQDSDSEESTSGYSSAPKLVNKPMTVDILEKKETCEKGTPKTRSLFTPTDESGGRTLFSSRSPQMNTSLSSRRPTFNASTFGSPNFVDRTLSTKRIMNSPFYSGNTIYGGASAYGRRLNKNAEEPNVGIRTSVQIKPINEKSTRENTTLSKTARRILSTLEQYSTPINDAKKIPIAPRKPGLLSTYVGATPYLVRDRKRPSNKELQVPSVPDLLQMKQRERLQNSTETVRQIAAKSKSSLNKEDYKLRTEEDNKQKYSNKMKSSVASVRQKVQPIEPVSEVKLPKVSLPITTLPKFDFVLIPPNSNVDETKNTNKTNDNSDVSETPVSTTVKRVVSVENKETENKNIEKRKSNDYTFSEPLVISKDVKPVTAINCFRFSDPLSKKQDADVNITFKSGESSLKSTVFKMKNNGENTNLKGIAKTASQLSTGSVMDVLGKKNETPITQNSDKTNGADWECPTCLVKNNLDKTECSACDEPKPQSQFENEENKGFGDQFKLSSDKWECKSCLVRNNDSDKKCVACTADKPSQDKQNGFGDKFKPPASTWECTSCLIRNKNELDTCAACGTAKLVKSLATSNFGDKFKPSNDTWECSTCMIRNKNDLEKCAACETTRPGSKTASTQKTMPFSITSTKFSFGIKSEWECKTCMIKNKNDLKKCAACETPKDSDDNKGFGDVFKVKSDEWECPSCMVRNKSTADVCVCCGITKPGRSIEKLSELTKNEEKKPVISFNFGIDKSGTTQFKFGIPSTKSEVKETVIVTSVPPTLTFGETTKTTSATTPSFTFGVQSQEKTPVATPVIFTSNSAPTVVTNPLLKPNEKLPEKVTPAPTGFKFGLDTNLNTSQANESTTSQTKTEMTAVTVSTSVPTSIPMFQFKPPAINGDISKPKSDDIKPKDSVSFGNEVKPKDMVTFGSDTNKSNIFGGDLNKPKDVMFGGELGKSQESPFGKPSKTTESSFITINKPADSLFGATTKAVDSPFGTTNKVTNSPFGIASKPIDSSFGNLSKPTEMPFGNVSKSVSSPFGSTNKPTDSPFGQSTESPFRNVSKPMESPFGKVSKPSESPFATASKPSESPFGNVSDNNPKESLFGTRNETNKPQSTLFSGVNEGSKPQESLFNSDANKPKEVLFGSKPTESGSLFANPSSTPAFTFTPKPIQSTTSAFPSATSSQPGAPIFKFGSNTSQNPMKKPFGDSSDNNMSNGFGSSPKIPAFGNPQGFGATENKPFAFGSTEPVSKNTGFSFGQTDKPNPAAPVFNFGGSAPSTSSGGFNFSVPSTGFNFGATAKVENQPFNPPSTNIFGPAGSGAKNGSFNFGTSTNNNNQKAVFSFGANQTTQPSQPSFPTQGPPGFNFGAPAPMSVPGGFNFTGAPPSFNFTDGSSAQTQTPRKIKKAFRRTPR